MLSIGIAVRIFATVDRMYIVQHRQTLTDEDKELSVSLVVVSTKIDPSCTYQLHSATSHTKGCLSGAEEKDQMMAYSTLHLLYAVAELTLSLSMLVQ